MVRLAVDLFRMLLFFELFFDESTGIVLFKTEIPALVCVYVYVCVCVCVCVGGGVVCVCVCVCV